MPIYDKNDTRLHRGMVHADAGVHPVYPYPQFSSHLAGLVTGTHDLTVFDLSTSENVGNRPAFYDHAHYLGSLSLVYATMFECGDIEHTNDWDWWVGITLRDGTRLGDSSWVIDPITDHTDEAQIQVLEKSEDEHGYCDTFTVPLTEDGNFAQTADPNTQVYAEMAVHIDRWAVHPHEPSIEVIRCDQIASIHIGQR